LGLYEDEAKKAASANKFESRTAKKDRGESTSSRNRSKLKYSGKFGLENQNTRDDTNNKSTGSIKIKTGPGPNINKGIDINNLNKNHKNT